MKIRFLKVLIFSSLCLVTKNKFLANESEVNIVQDYEVTECPYIFAKVDRLRLRKVPDFKEGPFAYLKEGEEVKYLGRNTEKADAVLRNVKITEYFYYIQRKDGAKGWAFGGGFQTYPLSNKPSRTVEILVNKYKAIQANMSKQRILFDQDINKKQNEKSKIVNNDTFLAEPAKAVFLEYGPPDACTCNHEKVMYFGDGKIVRQGGGTSYILLDDFKPLKNGIYKEMTSEQLIKLFGAPLYNSNDIFEYHTPNGVVDFYFQKNRLVYVVFLDYSSC